MLDRYDYFDEMHTIFYVNTDPECAKKFGLDHSEVHVMLNLHEKTYREEPYIIAKEEAFTMEEISEFVNTNVARSIPRWSRRTHNTLHGLHDITANAIVYVVKDLDVDDETLENDFQFHAFMDIIKITQEYDFGKMIPIITTLGKEVVVPDIPKLTDLLGDIQHINLPRFFSYHGLSGQTHFFPHQFEGNEVPNAEYIFLWAVQAALMEDIYLANKTVQIMKNDDEIDKDKSYYKTRQYWKQYRAVAEEHLETVHAALGEIADAETAAYNDNIDKQEEN